MPMLSDAWERVVERIGRRGALIEALVHHMNATFGISQDPRWPGVVRRIVERSPGRDALVRFVRYPTHQRFLKAMAAGDRELDGRPLTRLWLEHPLARRWKACNKLAQKRRIMREGDRRVGETGRRQPLAGFFSFGAKFFPRIWQSPWVLVRPSRRHGRCRFPPDKGTFDVGGPAILLRRSPL